MACLLHWARAMKVVRSVAIALTLVAVLPTMAASCWLSARPYRGPSLQKGALAHGRALIARDRGATRERRPSADPHVTQHRAPVVSPISGGAENILLVGTDRGAGRPGSGLADTILVARLAQHGEIAVISIPRDLYVPIPDHREDRINTVLNVAAARGEDGLGLLGRVIANTLGLPVGHAILIDLGVLERAVDLIGGINVEVPCPIMDNFIDSREPSGRRPLEVGVGRQHMVGTTASMYVRSRHGRSDWSRARRQQAVLVGMKERLGTVGGIAQAPALWRELEDSITTDMSRFELFSLVRRVAATPASRLHGVVLGNKETRPSVTEDGRSVLLPDPEAIARAMGGAFSAAAPGRLPPRAECPPADVALRHRAKANGTAGADSP